MANFIPAVPYHNFDFGELEEKWPSPFVERAQIGVLTGGILHPLSMKNLDNKGEGLPRVRIGRRIAYRVRDVVDYLSCKSQRFQ